MDEEEDEDDDEDDEIQQSEQEEEEDEDVDEDEADDENKTYDIIYLRSLNCQCFILLLGVLEIIMRYCKKRKENVISPALFVYVFCVHLAFVFHSKASNWSTFRKALTEVKLCIWHKYIFSIF